MDGEVGFQRIRSVRAPESIVAQFREAIRSGRISPGDRLPSERDLARILRVGRTTVREAIRALESLGVVESRPGRGTFLVQADIGATVRSAPRRSWKEHEAVFEARLLIEPQIAAYAAVRATAGDIASLGRILVQQAAQVEAGETGMAADLAFHAALSRIARSTVLRRFLESLADVLHESRKAVARVKGRPASSLREHEAVRAAIQARDPDAARAQMLEHIQAAKAVVVAARAWTQRRAS
jgi:GntR family transcriptional repressor for pyruvate dehydrogenase complex